MNARRLRVSSLIGLTLVLAVTLLVNPAAARNGGSPRPAGDRMAGAAAARATIAVTLCAKPGTLTLIDGVVVNIWGYALKPTGLLCSDSTVVPTLPGPVLEAVEGDTLIITLENLLPMNVSVVIPGLEQVPDSVGVIAGGSAAYTFTVGRPGTFLYESGVDADTQVPMGLYGALVVHSAAAGTAYPGVPFDAEKVLVLSEIDPVLNADPLAFNHYTYEPRYWLINGKAFPQTDEIVAQPGQNLLLRYLNAGLTNQTMTLLGADQRVVATDAWPVNYTADVVSQIIPAGQTIDTIVEVPANLPAGSDIPLYNRHMHVVNGGFFPGGMASFVTVRQPGVLAGLTAGWLGGSPRPRTPMLFRARVTSGTNVTYTWDFGDGMIQQGYLVWHTFPEFGIYTVTITATSGAEQIQQILTVPIVGLPMYFPFITR